MSAQYTRELDVALRTVQRAAVLTKNVLRQLDNNVSAETKADDSPVTIADFAAQSLIISAIHSAFPEDSFIGEESASALRQDATLRSKVWDLVSAAPVSSGGELATPKTVDEMLDAIDLGTSEQTAKGRVWVLDPVDGTATFMKGQQYAVCLCLLVDGVQEVGVIAAPNLRFASLSGGERIHEDLVDSEGYGVILSAVRGQGTFVRSVGVDGLGGAEKVERGRPAGELDLKALNFVESAPGSTSLLQSSHKAVAEALGVKWPGTVLWSQQMKYVSLTLGASDVMLRIPKDKSRYTQVWDHSGGQLLFQEVGGLIRDLNGGEIEFGQGRRIVGEKNLGMIATMPWYMESVKEAVHRVREGVSI